MSLICKQNIRSTLMVSNKYAIFVMFVLATVGVSILAAMWVDTTTAPEFIRNYSIRVLVTILAIGGLSVIIQKYRE